MSKNQHLRMIKCFNIHIRHLCSCGVHREILPVYRSDEIIHPLRHTFKKTSLSLMIRITDDHMPDRNIIAVEIATKIHYIRLRTTQQRHAHPFPRPDMTTRSQILKILMHLLRRRIRKKHRTIMICRSQKLQPLLLRRLHILPDRRISMP